MVVHIFPIFKIKCQTGFKKTLKLIWVDSRLAGMWWQERCPCLTPSLSSRSHICITFVPVGSQPAAVIPPEDRKTGFSLWIWQKIVDCRQGDVWNVLSTTSKQQPLSTGEWWQGLWDRRERRGGCFPLMCSLMEEKADRDSEWRQMIFFFEQKPCRFILLRVKIYNYKMFIILFLIPRDIHFSAWEGVKSSKQQLTKPNAHYSWLCCSSSSHSDVHSYCFFFFLNVYYVPIILLGSRHNSYFLCCRPVSQTLPCVGIIWAFALSPESRVSTVGSRN